MTIAQRTRSAGEEPGVTIIANRKCQRMECRPHALQDMGIFQKDMMNPAICPVIWPMEIYSALRILGALKHTVLNVMALLTMVPVRAT